MTESTSTYEKAEYNSWEELLSTKKTADIPIKKSEKADKKKIQQKRSRQSKGEALINFIDIAIKLVDEQDVLVKYVETT